MNNMNHASSCCVRDHIPLEQGLRRILPFRTCPILECQRPYSIRTRIKTRCRNPAFSPAIVRDHIPLEQGLRPNRYVIHVHATAYVRDHIPLEQGLRRNAHLPLLWVIWKSETIFH